MGCAVIPLHLSCHSTSHCMQFSTVKYTKDLLLMYQGHVVGSNRPCVLAVYTPPCQPPHPPLNTESAPTSTWGRGREGEERERERERGKEEEEGEGEGKGEGE